MPHSPPYRVEFYEDVTRHHEPEAWPCARLHHTWETRDAAVEAARGALPEIRKQLGAHIRYRIADQVNYTVDIGPGFQDDHLY
jgi:hypothetical protein